VSNRVGEGRGEVGELRKGQVETPFRDREG
jgi:hypothetical protein